MWEQPEPLRQLLEEADLALCENESARLTLFNEELGTMTLTGANVDHALSSEDLVEQFFDAIDNASDCTVEIANIEVKPEVLEKLESLFDYVEVVS